MAQHYLEFERPIAELETKIEELSKLSETAGAGAFDSEIEALRARIVELRAEAYARLDPWQKTQVARHPERPHFVNYVAGLIEEFVELRGDRKFADDQAIVGGLGRFRGTPVVVMGHEKGHDTTTRLKHNFGMARPEGYRKARRIMELAGRFGLHILSFVDTAGAFPGIEAEARGQAEAIARSIEACLEAPVPFVATIIGEGGSGGAIALAAADRILMLEHSIYSVISPEGCASILWRDAAEASTAAEAMKLTAEDLLRLNLVDAAVPEPLGGAHRDAAHTIDAVSAEVWAALEPLLALDGATLRARRREKFLEMGRNAMA